MSRDDRSIPRRFWEVYGLTLLFVGVTVYAAVSGLGPWILVPAAVAGWGIFVSMMTVYRMGWARGLRQAAEWIEAAHDDMLAGQAELEEIVARQDGGGQHFEGPS